MAALALFLVIAGGSAYAVNEWTGANIVDDSLTGADVKGKQGNSTTPSANGSLTSADIAGQEANAGNGTPFIDGTLTQWDLRNNSVTGSDVLESSLGLVPNADKLDGIDSTGLVQGRGTLLSNRIVFVPTGDAPVEKVLLDVPGLGRFTALCDNVEAQVNWENTTSGPIDFWTDIGGFMKGKVVVAGPEPQSVAIAPAPPIPYGSTVGLGIGNDPGARRVATLQVFAFQSGLRAPCGFQVQGTLWVSP